MKILHINVNYITSALHQTMIEHMNTITNLENSVFVPTYDKSRCVIEPQKYVTISECFHKIDRLFYHNKQNKIQKALIDSYDVSKFNCLHAYTLFTDGGVAMKLSKMYGVPYVVAIRNTDVNVFFKRMIHLRSYGIQILKNASAIFFLSSSYKDEVLSNYVPQKDREDIISKSYIIPNGIDDYWLDNISFSSKQRENKSFLPKETVKLIYAGGIDKNKNITILCDIIDLLKSKGQEANLTVVGKIKDEKVFNLIKEKVIYYEAMPKHELINLYKDADIFIMLSHHETFGLVYAEAMSQGLPVVYTKGQGFDGQFENGLIGFSASDTDPLDGANAILKICDNYYSISQQAVNNVGRFKWSKICASYNDIYRTIIK